MERVILFLNRVHMHYLFSSYFSLTYCYNDFCKICQLTPFWSQKIDPTIALSTTEYMAYEGGMHVLIIHMNSYAKGAYLL